MVIDHDGRHRAIYMITQGVEEMIVLIHSNLKAKDMCHKVVNEDGQMCYLSLIHISEPTRPY